MFDYESMRLIWWALLGVLLIGFAVMDGFDLGVAILMPYVARTDIERRIVINTVGPVWEGNQVWLILGGGAIFAAWPALYATAFSGFYLAMFLVLAALILRPVSFKFRSKVAATRWRAIWDAAIFVSGLVPALIFGVAFGNVIVGVPFRFDDTLRMTYEGGLFGLLNPFALVSGLISVGMLTLHGASYLALKASGPVVGRAVSVARLVAPVTIVLFVLAGIWVAFGIDGYVVTSQLAHDGPSNPLSKQVTRQAGAWLTNYRTFPLTMMAPVAAVAALAIAPAMLRAGRAGLGFIVSGVGTASIIATAGLSLFPFMLPSSLEPQASLTVWDASSSHLTLKIMLFATVVFLPLVLLYTAWVYRVLRGPVTAAYIEGNDHSLY
ncbi:MAG: cytochrome d ubiquinol oxidase subunit II [Bradyrhizobium sp.]|uniref:cytochrome d ubiquinol oxidase subunit II n=1 Tax=Bradyrhizobium sp. TaxID=376 RepID=UPI00121A7342|nr:cytochrome d ubiquinol oxidase subunit II [Bradyrhizobium sp.]THD62325.1 MAG: cytochrome d ubiquinol oxidase subunit II [Bradyrhizobium sp.]